MEKLVFATNNQNKVTEIRAVLGGRFTIVTLQEAGIDIDIPEPHNTLEANASEKSKTIFALTGSNCFGEDTGLEVAALNGEPGVKSARYSDDSRNFSRNIDKLLHNLAGAGNREARFRTVISLMLEGQEYLFEGTCNGRITEKCNGSNGFGYDPVFIPDGNSKTFAEMDITEKNIYSHRKKAVEKLVTFLMQKTENQ
jgi:XTP/dITP diphosphohydrolase